MAGTAEKMSKRICTYLMDISSLNDVSDEEEQSQDEEDDKDKTNPILPEDRNNVEGNQNLHTADLRKSTLTLTGFGQHTVNTTGFFAASIKIDDDDFSTTIHVVPRESMAAEVIVGQELLNQANLMVDKDGIKIRSRSNDTFLYIQSVEEELNIEKTASSESKDEAPSYSSPRRLPFNEREIVKNQGDEWVSEGIVEPCCSEWTSPVVVVRKKDGSPRVCIDYRKTNQQVMQDRYPLSLIEDQLDRLQDAKCFTTIDLKNGFFHVVVEEESQKHTA
ncbi:hypothetical protein ILUMI_00018 [Ignelater luminosus]|uniref:Reverse transcriptase domain-containing protein n=1 Tax=Ignelater luminosus TaxID=2038154 RepID=A0A8K0DTF4_IGNLU|nr:hypothetical protein ILUMI_00018 [Ignelater luminosus]